MLQENLHWIIGILIILILIFLWNNFSKKKRLRKFKKQLISSWGKPKKTEYYNFFSIGQYFNKTANKQKAFHIISDRTANDLDIDAIFKYLDRTSSKIGQQFLYYKLRTVQSITSLEQFNQLNELFISDEKLRLNCQLSLSKLNAHAVYDFESIINDEPIKKPTYLKFIYALSILAAILIILTFFNPIFSLFLLPVFFINIVFHYKNKQHVNYYINTINYLNKSLKVGEELARNTKIALHFKEVSFLKEIRKIKLKTEFISFDKHFDDPFLSIVLMLVELFKIQFNLSTIIFFNFIDSVTSKKESIDALFQFIGEIDSAISIASVKSGDLKFCKPKFTSDTKINTKELYHPLVENCIKNDIQLNNKSLLLTGSNMSGKTTFIRSLALNSILAQTFNFTFSKEFITPFLKVFSSIRIADDVLEETSYYLKEVLTIKELIENSKSDVPCLFVLDEIFKGTNTVERISGGKGILSYLNKKQHFVLVSTHDIELTDLLKKDNFELYHFTEKVNNNELLFDHKLKKGKLTTRNAIKILDIYNYPQEIINEAKRIEKKYFT